MHQRTLDPTSSPLAAFAVQLRRSREAKGLTQGELGKLITYSNAYISKIETAKVAPSLNFVQDAEAHLGAGGTLELLWWSWKNGSLIPGFPEYAAEEARCIKLRAYQTGVIPGLFQTPEYATALAKAAVQRGTITQAQAEERVSMLAARQRRVLDRPRPPAIHTVMAESCALQQVGGAETMARQLGHVLALADQPNVTIQVAPFSLGERVPFVLPVVLLTLPNRALVGYAETPARGYLERDSTLCSSWETDYDQLLGESLPTGASLDLIRTVRKALA